MLRLVLRLRWILAVVVGLVLLALEPASALPATLELHGLMDVTAVGKDDAIEYNWLNYGDSQFDAWRLRFFANSDLGNGFQVYTQTLFSDAVMARVYGAYVTYTPYPGLDLHLMAGKIPWRIGTYGPRTYSDKKPLIGTPLMYQYHTSLRGDRLVPGADALLSAAGTGQYGPIYDAAGPGGRGMPIVYDACWDFGTVATASVRPFEYSFGFVNGSPGLQNPTLDANSGKSLLGRIGAWPLPGLRLGVSGSYGPYLPNRLDPQLPAGRSAEDYAQRLLMADAELDFGHVELRGEGFTNTWETPTVGNLDTYGYYLEGKYALPVGAWMAGRWEVMRFGDLADSTGWSRPWDDDMTRIETGLGYRVRRDVVAKAVYQLNLEQEFEAGKKEDDSYELWAVQLSLSF